MSAKQTAEFLRTNNEAYRSGTGSMATGDQIADAIDNAIEYLSRMDQVITLIKLGAPDQSTAAIVDLLENGL